MTSFMGDPSLGPLIGYTIDNNGATSSNGVAFTQQSLAVDGFYIILTGSLNRYSNSYSMTSRIRFMDVRTEKWTDFPYGSGQSVSR